MTAPKRGEYWWIALFGAPGPAPAKLGYAGWYIIGEGGVVNETAIEFVGAQIKWHTGEMRRYAGVKMEMERDG